MKNYAQFSVLITELLHKYMAYIYLLFQVKWSHNSQCPFFLLWTEKDATAKHFHKAKKETAVLPKIKINRKDYLTLVVLSSNRKGKVGMGRVKI